MLRWRRPRLSVHVAQITVPLLRYRHAQICSAANAVRFLRLAFQPGLIIYIVFTVFVWAAGRIPGYDGAAVGQRVDALERSAAVRASDELPARGHLGDQIFRELLSSRS